MFLHSGNALVIQLDDNGSLRSATGRYGSAPRALPPRFVLWFIAEMEIGSALVPDSARVVGTGENGFATGDNDRSFHRTQVHSISLWNEMSTGNVHIVLERNTGNCTARKISENRVAVVE